MKQEVKMASIQEKILQEHTLFWQVRELLQHPPSNKYIARLDEKEKFLLFNYAFHSPQFSFKNLGDYIQTLAVKYAIELLYDNFEIEYYDRDVLNYYKLSENNKVNEQAIVIMQGWFAHSAFSMPNSLMLPVYIGMHFTESFQRFLEKLLVFEPKYFSEVGCRDLYTMQFCEKMGINSYLSRCLTLVFPKRDRTDAQKKVFLVDVPEEFLPYFPNAILSESIKINQRRVIVDTWSEEFYFKKAQELLDIYKREARLVITIDLHCAAPCIAMGIPVILIVSREEQKRRFSALNGILDAYGIDDFKKRKVNFEPEQINIEELKEYILENLKLSIAQIKGEEFDRKYLQYLRSKIHHFNVL